MTALGLAARWIHLACGLGLVGVWSATLLAGRSNRPTALAWASRTRILTGWLIGAVAVSGLATLAYQSMIVAGRTEALLDPWVWLRLLMHSRFGTVWLIRHGLLLLLAALIILRERERSAADTIAWRLESCMLSAAAAGAAAWAGHAAAVEPPSVFAVFSDALHLIAAGTWLGALLPLALLLRASSTEAGADARPYAVLAIRRFSAFALSAMLLVVATGLCNAWIEVGGVPALVGTRYGWLLLVKSALLAPIVVFAQLNRRRLLPALSGDGATVGRPAMARLSCFIGWELALALLILLVTAGLSVTAPARHESPWWPFGFRLSYDAVAGVPGIGSRLLIGGQLAFLGLLAAIIGWLVKSRRGLVLGAGAVALGGGLWIALPPLALDAYPTTYRRSPVPYHAASVAKGGALYASRCATCHGQRGKGDGPGAAGLPRPPADLTAAHTARHTAGDLYWWITNGIPQSGMPSFGDSVSEDERWDLINFLRALSAGTEAGALTPLVTSNLSRLVAPDFTYAVGPTPTRALREFRGRRAVVLVLFSVPASRGRIRQLAEHHATIQILGGEVVAVPVHSGQQIIRRLGGDPPILFPVVTEGGADIVRTYRLFAHGPDSSEPAHVEFLVDRQGYLRARWLVGARGPGWSDPRMLEDQIERLNAEPRTAPPPDAHVH